MPKTLNAQGYQRLITDADLSFGPIIVGPVVIGGYNELALYVDHSNHISLSQIDITCEVSQEGTNWHWPLDDSNAQEMSRQKTGLTSDEKWIWNFNSFEGNFARFHINAVSAALGDIITVSTLVMG